MTGFLAGLLLLTLPAAPAASADKPARPSIQALKTRLEDDRLEVSFRVANGLAAGALERIRSGLRLNQHHRVEVLGRRAVPLWPAKVHARLRIDTSAVYDSLTRRYDLTRTIWTGPRKKKHADAIEQHRSTDSVEELRSWMTEFDSLPVLVLPDSTRGARLRLRVESTLGRRFVLYIFPTKLTASAERRLDR